MSQITGSSNDNYKLTTDIFKVPFFKCIITNKKHLKV